MKMVKIPLSDATLEQMRYFALQVENLPIAEKSSAAVFRSKILLARPDGTIMVPEDMAGTTAAAQDETPSEVASISPRKIRSPNGLTEAEIEEAGNQYVTIKIDKQGPGEGSRPVFVAVNGVGILIERGKPQRVKQKYVWVLSAAIKTEYNQDDTGEIYSNDTPAYPFQIL